MALSYTFYKNDGTSVSEQLPFMPATPFPDPAADFGWSVQGKTFKGWNTESDGSGTFYYTGDTIWENAGRTFYAIWEAPAIAYLTTDRDLTSIASAIRTKGGTSAQLTFPQGFVDAVGAIPTGGITPTGTKQITLTDNGTTTEDVTNYASAQITVAIPVYNGEIVTSGYNVTISLTNPIEPSYFLGCEIWNIPEYGGPLGDDLLGSISSPDGTTTITVNSGEMIGVTFGSNWGVAYSNSDISVSGGVSFVGRAPGYDYAAFSITGDGTITFDSVSYYDD